eukprot:CAMPEP_0115179062 /NCGR_PEP_ID=MMETSP0270-20121206/6220_1 /TAXON_ID=71861 /ORGANISM="Scrippsiella trochoidea, Strain CCMP3099" /LENGTH=258 /DNA_ID=CAMNT_0002592039 /DNA_START=96 /DNA_END=869 /DNA_ORIENTATION=-
MGSNVADEPTATIVVMTIGGEAVCRFEAGSDISGLDIKRRVEELEGTAVNQQRLLVGGTLLSDTSQVDVADSAEVGVRLVRLPPSELVTIEGGQGRCVSVDEASGAIRPGPSFQWRMAAVDDGEFTFEAVGGPHAGKFISALEGKAYTKETELVLADLPETWRIVTSDQNASTGGFVGDRSLSGSARQGQPLTSLAFSGVGSLTITTWQKNQGTSSMATRLTLSRMKLEATQLVHVSRLAANQMSGGCMAQAIVLAAG